MNDRSLISYSFNTAWFLFKGNWKTMIGVAILLFALVMVANALGFILFEEESMSYAFWNFGVFIFSGWLALGLYRVFLAIASGESVSVKKLFSQGIAPVLFFVIASMLYGLVVGVGFILLIIPGIFVGIKLYFYDIIIADKHYDPIKALKTSWALTKGHWWQLLGLLVLLILLNLAGMMALGVGLIITVPVSAMGLVCAYRYVSSLNETLEEDQEQGSGGSKEQTGESFTEEEMTAS
ncbi:MAG: hypothetical protein ACLFNR_01725 [Candidatus Paceibacterota bacterium]